MWRVKSPDAILATAKQGSLNRSLGPVQLTLLGVGAVLGTGIFVLTAVAAQKAGPGMMWSFVVAGAVCATVALCYAELAAMVPASGSAYTYTYASVGEPLAWIVGWALILEYAVGASTVSVGWSGYFMGLIRDATGLQLPELLRAGPAWRLEGWMPVADFSHGMVDLPAIVLVVAVTLLLMISVTESARLNAVLVAIKIAALVTFIVVAFPTLKTGNFSPLAPNGWFGPQGTSGMGVIGAAASIFFAYVGFDAVSTAAEETRNPQRSLPIALIGSLGICTVFYLLVAAGAIGAVGAQPVVGADGQALEPGSAGFVAACQLAANTERLVCSNEALAHVLHLINRPIVGDAIGLAANVALPSVILMMMYGQTRVFFVMARDGLLPSAFARVHAKWKTPYVVILFTGICVATVAAFFPVGELADISNSGVLFAFFMVSISVLVLRAKEPDRPRPFKVPLVWIIAPLSALGCAFLFWNLPYSAKMMLPVWGGIGLVVYLLYGIRMSHVGRGLVMPGAQAADIPLPRAANESLER